MPMAWTLVLVLFFGTAAERRMVIATRIPTWSECIARAFAQIQTAPNLAIVRCEPSKLDVAAR